MRSLPLSLGIVQHYDSTTGARIAAYVIAVALKQTLPNEIIPRLCQVIHKQLIMPRDAKPGNVVKICLYKDFHEVFWFDGIKGVSSQTMYGLNSSKIVGRNKEGGALQADGTDMLVFYSEVRKVRKWWRLRSILKFSPVQCKIAKTGA
jgi:hypothetical protein